MADSGRGGYIFLQKIVPQHLFSAFMGWLGKIQNSFIKNWMIHTFIRRYQVDMSEAKIENPESYPDFNHFFTRELKPELRPIVSGENTIASPVDGVIAQIGKIHINQLLQVKGLYYDLETLLGEPSLAAPFHDGAYVTYYLAPKNYHRVHMPVAGRLIKSIYIPGTLFSVNRITSEIIPQLFTRNERLVLLFETALGRMAVILVGAIIVGNIKAVWMDKPVRSNQMQITTPSDIQLQKGDELGYFTLGSTVIVLFEKDKTEWNDKLQGEMQVKMGEWMGSL